MNCPTCNEPMTPLFTTAFCAKCEGDEAYVPTVHRGFVIWRSRSPGSTEYVFISRHDAEVWRDAVNMSRFPVRPVLSTKPFVWKDSTGTVEGIQIATHVHGIFSSKDELERAALPDDYYTAYLETE